MGLSAVLVLASPPVVYLAALNLRGELGGKPPAIGRRHFGDAPRPAMAAAAGKGWPLR